MIIRHEVAWEAEDLPKLLHSPDARVIHGRRQSGKSTELMTIARWRHGNEFAFVCMNQNMAELAEHLYWKTFTPIQYIDVEPASPKMPKKREWPKFVSAQNLSKLDGLLPVNNVSVPIYVDEWNSIHPSQQRQILDRNFIVAVTS